MVESTKGAGQTLAQKYKREECENLLKRKFFVAPSFEIYGGVAGFFDYGPLGCAVKNNIETLWRNHFVLEEDMLEIAATNLTLSNVLQTSGHVDKFEDLMVKDLKTGTPRRADKVIQEYIEKEMPKLRKKKKTAMIAELEKLDADVEEYTAEQIDATIEKYGIKDPDTGNALGKAVPFNLMFDTMIGPTGQMKGYLRPETAQGMFINFRRLLDYNNGKLPFAAAQVGLGFRNEISPRQGLLRVREFAMAEIEHFVDPQNKNHPKFAAFADEVLNLYSAKDQEDESVKGPTRTRIGDAVANGIVGNETMAYFVTRTNLFLKSVGIRDEAIRFRQHRSNEMAHYANDCWDAEVETSYGWIEVVGHSDRSAFDLRKHSEATKTELVAARRLAEPIELTEIKAVLNKAVNGKELKGDNKIVNKFFETAPADCIAELAETMKNSNKITISLEGKSIDLTEKNVKFEEKKTVTHEEKFIPHVIEPAFGIGRVLYCVFEHCFKMRENDVNRTYFDFPPTVAPLKTSILPLMNNPEMNKKTQEIKSMLIKAGISNKVDDSGVTVGKRYARTDECGIPFAITVDFDTLEDDTVTLRELDSTKQIRLPIGELAQLLIDLTSEYTTWADVVKKYGLFTQAEATEEETKTKADSKPAKKESDAKPAKKEAEPKQTKKEKAKAPAAKSSSPVEQALTEKTWLGGDAPSEADREQFAKFEKNPPSAEQDPYTHAWFFLVSQFSEEVRASWGPAQDPNAKNAGKKGKK